MRALFLSLAVAATTLAPGLAPAQDLVPERRLTYWSNTDLPGGDFASQRDIALEGCETACISDSRCESFTYNTRFSACFLKSGAGEPAFYQGAFSARVLTTEPQAQARAAARRGELGFLDGGDFQGALDQARRLGGLHIAEGLPAQDHLASAAEAERARNFAAAASYVGAAANLTDAATTWAEYARLALLAAGQNSSEASLWRQRALSATINAYLRAESPAVRHGVLVTMGAVLEQRGRGRQTVQALRLAQSLQHRDDTERLLTDAIGKYGFRITEHQVQSDSAEPRLCAVFSENLAEAGVDWSTFVQLPQGGLSVERTGNRQLCVEGLAHGQRIEVTFRDGLPAADGQTLSRAVTLSAYVRDRTPAVRFPGRGYVLPRGPGAAVPVETVNTTALDLTLYRVEDRNILRAVQGDYFGQPMEPWREDSFAGRIGTELWTGTATVGMEVNRDMTTRLPLDEALAGQGAGIYLLKAHVQGADEYDNAPGWQWFVISDLGLTTYWGADGLTVAVRSLGNAAARGGVTVELLGRANAVLASATTDAAGLVRFDPGLTRGTGGAAPAMIVAKDGEEDLAFLSLTDPEFDLSDRGVSGRDPAPPVDVFVSTERGAYRAGETVYATALARDGQVRGVTGMPLTAVWKRPDGVEHSRAVVTDTAGGYVLSQPIAANAPRGMWRLELLADLDAPPLAAQTFLVEDFLPERIDFTLTLPEGPLALDGMPEIAVEARYLFGAPGAELAIEGDVVLLRAPGLPDWPGYVFGRHDADFSARMDSIESGVTDAEGRALIAAPLPQLEDPGIPLQARFAVRVAEGSGRPVERRVTAPVAPSGPMIGLRPLFDDVVPENGQAEFMIAGVGPDGRATDLPVAWELNRIQTRYQWYQEYGSWYWDSVQTRSRVARGEISTGTEPQRISAPVTWGQYELVAVTRDGQATTSLTFYAGWYAPADVTSTPDTLEVGLDAAAYRPGDTAQLRVVARAAGTALVAVLSNRLVALDSVELAEGENLIPIPVTADWGAGAYVTVSAIRPMDAAAGRNPARALGLAYAAVDPGERRLEVAVETAPEAMPRGPMQVAVRVDGAAGEQAWVTLAAVDVGILNLTGFTAPDPSDHYFGRRKLGVGIRDLYGKLIDGLNGAEGVVRSGGDAGAQARLQADPPTEELVAYFTGPVEVGEDGYARATFDLPAFNGTVRVMAVAWTQDAVGQASTDVLVRDPVVVTASLPRFLAPGDESRLLLEIVHARGPTGRVGLDVASSGLTLGPVPSGFDLGEQAKQVVSVPVTASTPGIQTAEIRLTTPDGQVLSRTVSLVVRANDPEVARLTRFDLAPGQSFTFDANAIAGLDPASATATMALGPIARMNAPGLLAALDRYPYGCTEQITSRALPLIYYDQVAQAMRLKGADDIRARISQAVEAVLLNQSSEGSFGLWSAGSGDFWLDAYVTDFLSRARANGHAVPDRAFRAALDNLRNQVNYQADFDRGGEALAYALMVLAREGAAAVGDLRYYADVKADAFATPLAQAQVGAALAAYGDQERADAMFRRAAARLSLTPDTRQVYRVDYGTATRDTAAVLALASEAGSQAVNGEELVSWLAARSGNLSTQEAVWMLLATHAMLDLPGVEGVTLNGAPARGPIARLIEGGGPVEPVVVTNGSPRPQTLTVTAYGVPTEAEPAGGNGYGIARSYYTLEGKAVDLSQGVAAGTRLAVVLEVTPFAGGEARLIVNDPLPAGFEIDNPNLLTGGQISALDWLDTETDVNHTEFRQERFVTALDRYNASPFRLAYIVRAVSPGAFHHPAASVEDMYRPDFRARSETGRVIVTE